ncbi:hypothetical protein F2P79_009758 [Pimephales promelas]|nr:hypothetical protein F2P79_009758 [Pimephales promelas]
MFLSAALPTECCVKPTSMMITSAFVEHAECDQCPLTPFLFGIVEERYALEQGTVIWALCSVRLRWRKPACFPSEPLLYVQCQEKVKKDPLSAVSLTVHASIAWRQNGPNLHR